MHYTGATPCFRFMLSVNGEREGHSQGTGWQGQMMGSSLDLKGKVSYNQKHESPLLGEGAEFGLELLVRE